MILVFIYLDRVVFKLRSVPRTFPTLSTWSKVEIGKRIFDEKKEAGNFGYGSVDSPLVKENLIDVAAGVDRATNDSGVNDGGESATNCIENLSSAALEFARSFRKFSTALNVAKSEPPHCEAVQKMKLLADGMMEGLNLSQKGNKEEVVKDGASGAVGKEQEADEVGEKGVDVDDDTFFSNPKLWAAVDEIVAAFKVNKKNEQRKTTPSPIKRKPTQKDPSIPSFKLLESDDEDQSTEDNEPHNTSNADDTPQPPFPVSEVPILRSKRNKDIPVVFRSPYIQRNVIIFSELTQLEKEVSDYAFNEHMDERYYCFFKFNASYVYFYASEFFNVYLI
ncbi:hypothetical protein RND81_12G033200 [Saponaria officinalis]|uniref:Uncharacterized protein n=1 Tax=Saponaria officinalis TaxID=3572 RepID=A0AAW1H4L6_SAPOF